MQHNPTMACVFVSWKYDVRDLRRISEDVVNGPEEFVGPRWFHHLFWSCCWKRKRQEKIKGKEKRCHVSVWRLCDCFLLVCWTERERENVGVSCVCVCAAHGNGMMVGMVACQLF